MAFSDAPAIKSIQRGTESWAVSSTAKTITINAVDWTKAFILFSHTGAAIDESSSLIEVIPASSTTVTFDWINGYTPGDINWTVIEFARGVSVQHYRNTTSTSTDTVVPINKVDLTKSFIITSWQGNATAESIRSSFTADDEVTLDRNSITIQNISIQIISWNGAKVQTIDDTFSSVGTSKDITITEVDLKHTIAFGSCNFSGGGNDDRAKGNFTSSTQFTLNRFTSGSTQISTYFIIEIPEFSIQSGRKSILTTVSSATETINPVFSSHSIPITANNGQYVGEGDQTGLRSDRGGYLLTLADTTLTFDRNSGSGDTFVNWYVLEYKERLAIRHIQRPTALLGDTEGSSKDVTIDKYTPEKTWHWANVDEVRRSNSMRFNVPGTNIFDENAITIQIANSYGPGQTFTPQATVVEFDTGITVQYNIDPGSNRPETLTINEVDLDHAGIFVQYDNDGGVEAFEDDVAQEFTFIDSTTVGIDNYPNSSDQTKSDIQVLEFHDAHVRTITENGNLASIDSTIPRVDAKKTFLTGTFKTASIVDVDSDDIKSWALDAIDNVNISAGVARSLPATIFAYAIDGPSNIKVQHLNHTFGATSSGNVTIEPVKLDRSFVMFNGFNGAWGRATVAGNRCDELQCKASFISDTSVAITRPLATSDGVTAEFSVIEVDPYPIEHFKRQCKLTVQGSLIEKTTTMPIHLTYKGGSASESNLPEEMFIGSGMFASQLHGGDIRVSSDAAGTNLLPLEIVDWHVEDASANGNGDAWARVPLVSGVDTDFYIWWKTAGNTKQVSPWLDDGSYQVWPTGEYAFVSHMSEYNVAADEGHWDSTAYDMKPDLISGPGYTTRADSLGGIGIETLTAGTVYIRFPDVARLNTLNQTGVGYTTYLLAQDIIDNTGRPFAIGESGSSAWVDNNGIFAMDRSPSGGDVDIHFGDSDGGENTMNLSPWYSPNTAFIVAGQSISDVAFGSIDGGTRGTSGFGGTPKVYATGGGYLFLFNSDINGVDFQGGISEVIVKTQDDGVEWDNTLYASITNLSGFIVPATPSGVNSPVPVTDDLVAQWDPSNSDSLTLSAGAVTYMKDLANGYNAYAQATNPTISSGTWNSLDVLDFDDSLNQRLALPWLPIEGADERFIWVIAKSNSSSVDRAIISIGDGGVSGGGYKLDKNLAAGDMDLDTGPGEGAVTASGWSFNDGPQVYGVSHDGTVTVGGTTFYYGEQTDATVNIDEVTDSDPINTIQGSGLYNWIGTDENGDTANDWDGQIAEILVYDRKLTTVETAAVFEYLRDKWLVASSGVPPVDGLQVFIVPSWIFQPQNVI